MGINFPPYTLTDKMLNLATSIMEKIGEANYFESLNSLPELKRKTRIQSIHSSLAIEDDFGKFRNHVEAVYDGEIKEAQSPLLSNLNENELSILRNKKL